MKKRIHIATPQSAAVGRRVRNLRLSMQLTQKKLGEMAMVSPNHISSIENGVENVSDDAISRLASALQTSFQYLKSGDEVALRKCEKRMSVRFRRDWNIPGQLSLTDLGLV